MSYMIQMYREQPSGMKEVFMVETTELLSADEFGAMRVVLSGAGTLENVQNVPSHRQGSVIGPLMYFETPNSSRMVDIMHGCGLTKVVRVEVFDWFDQDQNDLLVQGVAPDKMTETWYEILPSSFDSGVEPEPMRHFDLITGGLTLLQGLNTDMGLGMDAMDMDSVMNLARHVLRRPVTDVELFQKAQGDSEHCRHHLFNGILYVDGVRMPDSLMDIIRRPLERRSSNVASAFSDNCMVIEGNDVEMLYPEHPGKPSRLVRRRVKLHSINKVETHNHPTAVAPDPGAATGSGGEIRDEGSTGKGSRPGGAVLGLCTADPRMPGFIQPWENTEGPFPNRLATAIRIVIEGSNGATRYENCIGRPGLGGFWRTCDLDLPSGERLAWLKPVASMGGIGSIDARHVDKEEPRKGMQILRLGGKAFNVGLGGGGASSMMLGVNTEELDFASVQRANAEMERRVDYVIRACTEMGDRIIILVIHDQGAGGPSNVTVEAVYPAGGRVDISQIRKGDASLSHLQTWSAEYQEGYIVLIDPEGLEEFTAICDRERAPYERLGEVTDDGMIVVHNADDAELLVNLPLEAILGNRPKKEFHFKSEERELTSLILPDGLTVDEALDMVLRLPSVSAKSWILHKLDRSVTGLVAQQPCCGPLQQPVNDCGIRADSHLGLTGTVIAIGENAVRMVVDPEAGPRMCAAEAVMNMAGAYVQGGLGNIKVSGNWMGPYKMEGEGARLLQSVRAVSKLQIALEGAETGSGKDSASMAADDGTGTYVKSPAMLQVTASAPMEDVTLSVTPDIKRPGESKLWYLDLGMGKMRMGGSALAHVYRQFGDESPDVDAQTLRSAFEIVQACVAEGVIEAYHDRSDGGLLITLLEMAFAGNCGMIVSLEERPNDVLWYLFNEELGAVFEVAPAHEARFKQIIEGHGLSDHLHDVGMTTLDKGIRVVLGNNTVLSADMRDKRNIWHEVSYHIECDPDQGNAETALEERENMYDPIEPEYRLTFTPAPTAPSILSRPDKPRVAILREQGCNSDREMGVAFTMAGFDAWDVTMSDLTDGRITLDQFRGVVAVGGFSFGDTSDAGAGWARKILLNPKLRVMFEEFLDREDIFSLGICNGAQMLPYLGILPWQGLADGQQPRFVENTSRKFESRWVSLLVGNTPSILLRGMEGSVLGAHVAHGEGRFQMFQDDGIYQALESQGLVCVQYADGRGEPTGEYPFCPNGSPLGIAGICSEDGRHTVMMPHTIDRAFLPWQWHHMPRQMRDELKVSPWMQMAQNAYEHVTT